MNFVIKNSHLLYAQHIHVWTAREIIDRKILVLFLRLAGKTYRLPRMGGNGNP